MNIISVSDARSRLTGLVDDAGKFLEKFYITVNSKPKAVLLSIEEFEALEEAIYVGSIPGLKESLKRGIKQAEKKEGELFEKIKR